MDVKELKEQLKAMGVPERYYAINGDLGSDKCILNKVYYYWEYFYFDAKMTIKPSVVKMRLVSIF